MLNNIKLYLFISILFCSGKLFSQEVHFVRDDSTQIIYSEEKYIFRSDPWLGRDKGLHFVGSMIGTALMININSELFKMSSNEAKFTGAGFIFTLGMSKELFDSKQAFNKFSWKDLAADAAGILIGLAIMEIK